MKVLDTMFNNHGTHVVMCRTYGVAQFPDNVQSVNVGDGFEMKQFPILFPLAPSVKCFL